MPRLGMRQPTMPPDTDIDRAGTRDVYDNEAQRAAASRFGLGLLCIALGMLFGAVVLLLFVLRFGEANWPTHLPPLPWQLWLSTGLLILESVVLAKAARMTQATLVHPLLCWTIVLAVAFIACQIWAWIVWHDAIAGEAVRRLALASLYVVTGVHIAHVLGGLVPLGLLAHSAKVRSWGDRQQAQVKLTAAYWHFLDAVWLVLVVTLLIVL